MKRSMQCKDIDAYSILERLERMIVNPSETSPVLRSRLATHYQVEGDNVIVCPPGANEKLLRAKLGSMKRKGLVVGCDCGCRGDWAITDLGLAQLATRRLG